MLRPSNRARRVLDSEGTGKPRLKRARLRRKRNIAKAVYESVCERNNNPNKKHSSRPPMGEGHGASASDLWTRGCCHTPSKGVRGTFLFEINNFNIQNGNGIMKATECFPKRKYFKMRSLFFVVVRSFVCLFSLFFPFSVPFLSPPPDKSRRGFKRVPVRPVRPTAKPQTENPM